MNAKKIAELIKKGLESDDSYLAGCKYSRPSGGPDLYLASHLLVWLNRTHEMNPPNTMFEEALQILKKSRVFDITTAVVLRR